MPYVLKILQYYLKPTWVHHTEWCVVYNCVCVFVCVCVCVCVSAHLFKWQPIHPWLIVDTLWNTIVYMHLIILPCIIFPTSTWRLLSSGDTVGIQSFWKTEIQVRTSLASAVAGPVYLLKESKLLHLVARFFVV